MSGAAQQAEVVVALAPVHMPVAVLVAVLSPTILQDSPSRCWKEARQGPQEAKCQVNNGRSAGGK